jgi:diguanylate cyclase (GGDEF)-like protein
MTGAYNRRYFAIQLEAALQRYKVSAEPFSLLFLDIDHFKKVNDTYGHDVGDKAICSLVKLCQERISPEDVLSRLGGEEFAILMPNCPSFHGAKIAGKVREDMEFYTDLPNDLRITVSIGVTPGKDQDTAESVMRRADQALYAAKHGGRNAVVVL